MRIYGFSILPLLLMVSSIMLSSCNLSRQAVVPTPTLDRANWKVYQDLSHPFSFEYPKSFDDRPLCALKVKQADIYSAASTISMNNSDLKVMIRPLQNPKDTDLQAVDDQLRNDLGQLPQVSFDQPIKLAVAGTPALAQRYHTAYSKDGYLEYVFFIKDGVLYTIFLNTPASCDGYPNTPDAADAFQRILDSFQIQ
jgi:hypothetical protein